MPEQIPQSEPRAREKATERIPTGKEKVHNYLRAEQIKLARRLETMQSGIPAGQQLSVATDFRIVPPPELYGSAEKEFDNKKALEHYGTLDQGQIREAEDKSAGTQFEMLKTAVMHKHIGERFIVVRSSLYDDKKNGVDNILVDTVSGQTVCAFDETNASFKGKALLDKTNTVLGKNFGTQDMITDQKYGVTQTTDDMGVRLRYGIELKDGKIKCAEMKHLPIFLLALDYEHLEEGQRTFVNGEGKSRYETNLFKYFLTSLSSQIQFLKLNKRYEGLPEELRKRVESFETYVQEKLPTLKN